MIHRACNMVTDAQLQAAIERAWKATPGPWQQDGAGCLPWQWAQRLPDWDDDLPVCIGSAWVGNETMPDNHMQRCICDAKFIAHARADVPAFARELQRVRELARKLLAAGTLDDGEREIVEAMLGGE